MDAGLDGDRLAGLALQAAEQAVDDKRGVSALFGAVEAGQIALQEVGEPVLTASDLLGCDNGVGQEGLGVASGWAKSDMMISPVGSPPRPS